MGNCFFLRAVVVSHCPVELRATPHIDISRPLVVCEPISNLALLKGQMLGPQRILRELNSRNNDHKLAHRSHRLLV